uniref:Uncharacterized protein n=1 Tax=Anopheles maculatus TaxID=74869 RepID=A0A182SR37_9DIPT
QLVTGTIPELPQDTDSFSEIDLTATNDPQTFSQPPTIDYNPLQDLEDTDTRGGTGGSQFGDNGEPSATSSSYLQQTSALTAQFAAQLPNVASTVFSTFSRVIKGSSPAPPSSLSAPSYANDHPSAYGVQPEFQSTTNNPYELLPPSAASSSLVPLINSSACDPSSYPPTAVAPGDHQHLGAQSSAELPPPPLPPTFYNPGQVPSASVQPPPTATGLSNTYRLGGSKKKTYAHIPGLNTTTHSAGPAAAPTLPTGKVPPVTLPPGPPSSAVPESLQAATVPSAVTFPPVSPPPVSTDIGVSFASASSQLTESTNQVAEEPPKSKSSLFSYLPNSILEKLPKPGFGSVKKEEPSPFIGGISSGSIVDQFVDVNASSLISPATVTPAASVAPPPLSSTSFFAPPPVVEFTQQPPGVSQASTSSFFTTPAPELGVEASPTAPPPAFFSPAQISTVRNAPVGASSAKSNPYSSSRVAGGVGRYKNPLAPIVPPAAGSIFLPNQPPPLAARQPGKLPIRKKSYNSSQHLVGIRRYKKAVYKLHQLQFLYTKNR